MTIGTKIKHQRELRNLTQEYVAGKAGVSQNAISQIERDELDPKYSTLERIASAFGTDVTHLVGFDDKRMYFNITDNHDHSNNGYIVQKDPEKDELHKKVIQQYEERLSDLKNYLDKIVKILDSKLG